MRINLPARLRLQLEANEFVEDVLFRINARRALVFTRLSAWIRLKAARICVHVYHPKNHACMRFIQQGPPQNPIFVGHTQ